MKANASSEQITGDFLVGSVMLLDQSHTFEKRIAMTVRLRLRSVFRLVESVAQKKKQDVDLVHRLRTESRRADAALRIFADWFSERRGKKLRQFLDDIRDKAGKVRDLDVLMFKLDKIRRSLSAELFRGLWDRAQTLRDRYRRILKRHCQALNRHDLQKKMRNLIQSSRSIEPTPATASNPCFLTIQQRTDEYLSAVDSIVSELPCLHRIRILGRRLRYSLELLPEILPEADTKSNCQVLSELQEIIGQAVDQHLVLIFMQSFELDCDSVTNTPSIRQAISSLQEAIPAQIQAVMQQVIEKSKELSFTK